MIAVRDLCLSYGDTAVLTNCTLSVAVGEHAALMGPSGCGKTTLLRVLAGLVKPASGSVRVNGRVAYVFQEPRLFPWLTAEENLAAVLPKGASVSPWLEKVGLADAAKKYPQELSGGMQQRLNLCRALAYGGDLLLLDEPFRGMDKPLRQEMTALIREEWGARTLLLVTHDEDEAAALADVIWDWRDGRFQRRIAL